MAENAEICALDRQPIDFDQRLSRVGPVYEHNSIQYTPRVGEIDAAKRLNPHLAVADLLQILQDLLFLKGPVMDRERQGDANHGHCRD